MAEAQKLFYSIGQVAQYTNLPQSVLRYWETVFDRLQPQKSPGGSRLYTQEDIELILTIKNFLYDQGFTIKGANQKLNQMALAEISETAQHTSVEQNFPNPDIPQIIARLKKLIKILED